MPSALLLGRRIGLERRLAKMFCAIVGCRSWDLFFDFWSFEAEKYMWIDGERADGGRYIYVVSVHLMLDRVLGWENKVPWRLSAPGPKNDKRTADSTLEQLQSNNFQAS